MPKDKSTKALKAREAELERKIAERKSKPKAADLPHLAALKRKELKALVADKTNGKVLRRAARAELEARDHAEHVDERAERALPSSKADRDARSPKAKVEAAADKVIAEPGTDGAKIAAKTAKAAATESTGDDTDEQIRARIKGKRERRDELLGEDYRAGIDRDDHDAVKAYNAELAELGGGAFLTSTAELEAEHERMREHEAELTGKTKAKPKGRPPVLTAAERKRAKAAEQVDPTLPLNAQIAQQIEQAAEEVETDHGREFAVGTSVAAETFGKPSEAPLSDFPTNGNGQYLVKRPADGKLVGYTRVTTYIDNLEDKTQLDKWKLRVLLEGVAIHDTEPAEGDAKTDRNDPVVAKVRDLIHVRDVAISKAHKADRKGKLTPGELGATIADAWSTFKRELNTLAEDMLELGGVHEKANRGTDLHAICEAFDNSGLSIDDYLAEHGTPDMTGTDLSKAERDARVGLTPSDEADLRAYAAAVEAAGLRWIPECTERPIVNHELKIAGRMDRGALWRPEGAQRAKRVVVDLKTGRIDYAIGKIAQQLDQYANGRGYDLETHDEVDLKLDKSQALLIHLPQGEARCAIYVVDLKLGHKGNALSGQVRAWRNEGKHAYDLKAPLVEYTQAVTS